MSQVASTSATHFDKTGSPHQPRLATATEFDAITRSVNVVRQRLCHLERVLQAFGPREGIYDESGQPLYGIDMNLLAATAAKSREESHTLGGSVGTSAGLPVPPQHNSFAQNGEQYEPKSGYRIDGIGGSQTAAYSLPPQPTSHGRIRDLDERERRMTESDGEVEAAVTLEYLVRLLLSFASPSPTFAHVGSMESSVGSWPGPERGPFPPR